MDSSRKTEELINKFGQSTSSTSTFVQSWNNKNSKNSTHRHSVSVNDDFSKELSNDSIYLEKGELSTDFTTIENTKSDNSTENSPNSVLNSLFGNNTVTTSSVKPIFPDKPINAYICIYSKNKAILPFFEYYFIWNEEKKYADFPKKIINIQSSPLEYIDEMDNETHSSIKTQIMNECLDYILDLFGLYDKINRVVLNKIFKGFIWKNDSSSIYLFFNGSGMSINEKIIFKKAILDEIINKQFIDSKSIRISPEIIDIFKENPSVNTIYMHDSNNRLKKIKVEYPMCLYLCDNRSSNETESHDIVWVNVLATDLSIEKTVDYSILGNFFYFSSIPLDDTEVSEIKWEERNKWKKYAVFLNLNNGRYPIEESYIVKDLSTINKEQLDTYYSKLNPLEVSSIWFKYKGIQLWGIKYPSQFQEIRN